MPTLNVSVVGRGDLNFRACGPQGTVSACKAGVLSGFGLTGLNYRPTETRAVFLVVDYGSGGGLGKCVVLYLKFVLICPCSGEGSPDGLVP